MSSLAFMFLFFGMFMFMGAARGGRRRWHRHQDRMEEGAGRDLRQLRDHVADMGARLERLEEERDFYRDLLGAESTLSRRVTASSDLRDTPKG